MAYSQLKKLNIKNFRPLGDAEISFEESPIVALTGENESGKTSVIKAFAVCGMNGYQQKQKDYIKTGAKGFHISLELEDGTVIQRIKSGTYNRILITKDDEIKFVADKIDRGEGVPAELEKVMGLVVEPETKECLHIRTYEDKLLFVGTPTSTNYKVVYDALKVDNLVRALKRGNTEINTLKSEITNAGNAIEVLETELASLVHYDLSSLEKIKERLLREKAYVGKLKSLTDKLDRADLLSREQCGLIKTLDLKTVNIPTISKFIKLKESLDTAERNICTYEEIAGMDPVDIGTGNNFASLIGLLDKESSCADYNEVSELSAIRLKPFNKYLELLQKLTDLMELSAKESELALKIKETDALLNREVKESGIKYKQCPNCGEVVIIE